MLKVAIVGQTLPVYCQNKRHCSVVTLTQLEEIVELGANKPYRTIGDYNPITKEWK